VKGFTSKHAVSLFFKY